MSNVLFLTSSKYKVTYGKWCNFYLSMIVSVSKVIWGLYDFDFGILIDPIWVFSFPY